MKKDIRDFLLLVPPFTDRPAAVNFAIEELSRIMTMCNLPYIGLTGVDVMGMANEKNVPLVSLGETELKKSYGLVADANVGGGFNIKSVGGNVFIYAPEPEGIVNGVYRFCEEVLGYKFYAEDEQRVDKRDEYLVPDDLDISVKPDFLGRRLDFYGLYRNPAYAARLRQNASATHCENAYHQGTGTPWAVLDDQSLALQLIPRDKYKTEEYIKKGWWSEEGDQLCWTKAYYDEEMFELLCANLIEAIKKEPTKLFYMLGQTDNNRYCKCPTCQADYEKYGVSGVFLRMVNKLADRVKEFIDREQGGREHYLCMFAYQQTVVPPVKIVDNKIVPLDESVIARDNVMIRIAPIEAGVNYSLIDPVNNPHSTLCFIGWKAVAKHFALWDYGTNFQGYIAPYSDCDVLGKTMRFYKELGAVDILTQLPAHTTGTAFWALKLYVRARLTWDVTLSERELTHEFISAYYGAAADEIEDYLNLVNAHFSRLVKETPYKGFIWEPVYLGVTWSRKKLNEIARIFGRAFKKTQSESPERRVVIEKRLRCESLFYRYVLLSAYIHTMDYDTLKPFYEAFKRDAEEAGTVAWKNGWRRGGGKMSTFFESVEKRLISMKKAAEYERADNNPLKDYAATKQS